jgi:hypothetical protein
MHELPEDRFVVIVFDDRTGNGFFMQRNDIHCQILYLSPLALRVPFDHVTDILLKLLRQESCNLSIAWLARLILGVLGHHFIDQRTVFGMVYYISNRKSVTCLSGMVGRSIL